MTPRRWQNDCRSVVIKHLLSDAGKREPGAISVVTGAGKGSLLPMLLYALRHERKLPPRVVIATSRSQLVTSLLLAAFAACDPSAPKHGKDAIQAGIDPVMAAIRKSEIVGQYDGRRKDPRPVTVTTYPSLPACLAAMGGADLLICDEAHRSAAPDALDAVMSVDLRFGMSGTLYLGDEKRTIAAFKRTLFRYSAADAIRDGVIVPAQVRLGSVAAPVEGEGIDRDRALAALLGELAADGGCSKMGPGVVAVSTVAEAQWLAGRVAALGLRGLAVSGQDSMRERRAAVAAVSDGAVDVVAMAKLWLEGVDCRAIRWLAPLTSLPRNELVQFFGRGVRTLDPVRDAASIAAFGPKTSCRVYDVCAVTAAADLEPDDALGERAPIERPKSKAAQRAAEIEAIVADCTPYAVRVSPLERWSMGLYDHVSKWPLLKRDPKMKMSPRPGAGLRMMPASEGQWKDLGRIATSLKWLSGPAAAAKRENAAQKQARAGIGDRVRSLIQGVIDARTATYGVAADLIAVLLLVRGHVNVVEAAVRAAGNPTERYRARGAMYVRVPEKLSGPAGAAPVSE